MVILPSSRTTRTGTERRLSRGACAIFGALFLASMTGAVVGGHASQGPPPGTLFYSTADPPREYRGPIPPEPSSENTVVERDRNAAGRVLAEANSAVDRALARTEGPPAQTKPNTSPAPAESVPRVASTSNRDAGPNRSGDVIRTTPSTEPLDADPIARAKRAIAECQARFVDVRDYTCTFHKRERIGGRLSAPHVMIMKARTQPASVYFKFVQPNRGREAIYVAGRNENKVVAHDVGFGKFLAGTLHLDPRGKMAMEDNLHPVTEAGIGHLIETVARHWAVELTPEESQMTFHPSVRVGNHPCTMIESLHPRHRPEFMFYLVKLYIDHEHGLPIRIESYNWPKQPGAAPELVEEYTYLNLKTNVGLTDRDFDPANRQYSYGRF